MQIVPRGYTGELFPPWQSSMMDDGCQQVDSVSGGTAYLNKQACPYPNLVLGYAVAPPKNRFGRSVPMLGLPAANGDESHSAKQVNLLKMQLVGL